MVTANNNLTLKLDFTREDLRALIEEREGWHLSLYMPLFRTGREVKQAPILLKNLQSRAAAGMEAKGCGPDTAAELLEPVNRILRDTDFGLLQGEGLAVHSSRGFSASFLMPMTPPAVAEVDRRFLLDPLLPLLFEDGRFVLLALSLKSVRLWEGDRLRLREIPLDGLATNMREALPLEKEEPFHMNQSGSAGSGGASGAGMHQIHGGGGTDNKDRKKDILEFFRMIDNGIRHRLPGPDLPLMLAGVDYLLPIYREANTHPRLLERAVEGNPEAGQSWDDLHEKAWNAYSWERARQKVGMLARYRERLATPEAATGVANVLPAAHAGRVASLFLRKGHHEWGWFDAAQQRIVLADRPGTDAEDLANLACVLTLLSGGKIFPVDAEELPAQVGMAALCRY